MKKHITQYDKLRRFLPIAKELLSLVIVLIKFFMQLVDLLNK
jgi:hypothetical protein